MCDYMRMNVNTEADRGPSDSDVDVVVEVFRMLADPTRVRLLVVLRDGELPVGELAERVDKPQTVVSRHLAKLRLVRLVHARRQGTHIFYSTANDHVLQLVTDALHHADHLGPDTPAHHQDTVDVTA